MSAPTPRGADVVRRAQQLGLSAEYVGPGVKIGGKTWAVSHAEAYVQGYFDGAGRAHRAESEQRRLERVIEIARDHAGRTILYRTLHRCMKARPTHETRMETRPALHRARHGPAPPPPLPRLVQGLDSEAVTVSLGRRCETRGCGYRLPVKCRKDRKFCVRCRKDRTTARKSTPRYRAQNSAESSRRYRDCPEVRERQRQGQREKYRTDPAFRESKSRARREDPNATERARERQTRYRQRHPERVRAQCRLWKARHPEALTRARDAEDRRIASLIEAYPHLSGFRRDQLLKVLNAP